MTSPKETIKNESLDSIIRESQATITKEKRGRGRPRKDSISPGINSNANPPSSGISSNGGAPAQGITGGGVAPQPIIDPGLSLVIAGTAKTLCHALAVKTGCDHLELDDLSAKTLGDDAALVKYYYFPDAIDPKTMALIKLGGTLITITQIKYQMFKEWKELEIKKYEHNRGVEVAS